MQAIIFLDRTGDELAPLHERFCPAMLPVAGRTLAEHCLEDLGAMGISEAFLVVGPGHQAIEDRLESGQRWSINLTYVLAAAHETPDDVRARLGRALKAPYLALRGDVLRPFGLPTRAIQEETSTAVSGLCWRAPAHGSLGMMRVERDPCRLTPLAWPLAAVAEPSGVEAVDIRELDEAHMAPLTTIAQYHREALNALARAMEKKDQGLDAALPAGLPRGIGLRAGKCSDVHHRSLESGQAWVGHFSRVHDEARLQGRVAIGDHCLIDRGARVSDSLVLDNSYVGAGVHLHNAIACEDSIIHLDSGAVLDIRDRFLLSRNVLDLDAAPMIQRGLGLALLVMSLPLWPLVALMSLVHAPRQPLEPVSLADAPSGTATKVTAPNSSQAISTWRWRLPERYPLAWLSNLPLLLPVVTGRLRLVGRSPFRRAQAEQPATPWQSVHRALPVGLISPADLFPRTRRRPELRELMELEWLTPGIPRRRLRTLGHRLLTFVRRSPRPTATPAAGTSNHSTTSSEPTQSRMPS
ncbi:hypothetical protein [Onishia taeanensis]